MSRRYTYCCSTGAARAVAVGAGVQHAAALLHPRNNPLLFVLCISSNVCWLYQLPRFVGTAVRVLLLQCGPSFHLQPEHAAPAAMASKRRLLRGSEHGRCWAQVSKEG
jgi:hypothetical protein